MTIEPLRVRGTTFTWGSRTYVMGILNATPDSFSGDGLLVREGDREGEPHAPAIAVARATSMAAEGADIIDIGGESTRPGHVEVDADEELRRVAPVIAAVRVALPDMPISVDTTKPAVAEAALRAGADMVNDIWGVSDDDALARVAAAHGAPLVVMHNRAEAVYDDLMSELVDDLRQALDRAVAAGVPRKRLVVDPGFGFGKTAEHNLVVLRDMVRLTSLGRPILLGTSRKSTLGKVLDLPADQRLEATIATTALGIAAGTDIVRVHDVAPNVRAARMADAVVRGTWQPAASDEGGHP